MAALTAKQILTQAHEILAASFWIQGDEFRMYEEKDWQEWWQGPPPTKLFDLPNGDHVIGVCSVGAIAIANVRKETDDTQSFEWLFGNDWNTTRAAYALATSISTSQLDPDIESSPFGVIATWNDKVGRSKKSVLDAFTRAVDSPFCTAKNIYVPWVYTGYDSDMYDNELSFFAATTKEQAQKNADYLMSFVGNQKKPPAYLKTIVTFLREYQEGYALSECPVEVRVRKVTVT